MTLKFLQLTGMALLTSMTLLAEDSLTGADIKEGKYKPNWESIKRHNGAPEWFLDGKFGIYTHWGPITKANLDRPNHIYGKDLYDKDDKTFAYHMEVHGGPDKVGYKDLIPQFQPVDFDATAWAKLFKEAGARFAGPVAMHHDNFAMWGSEVTPWNIKKTFGRDTCAELEQAIRKEGMKFLMSFHHAFSWRYYVHAYQYDAGIPGNEKLYFTPHDDKVRQRDPEAAQFRKEWLAKLVESIDKYQPDFIWFDWGIAAMPDEPVIDFFTHYLNSAAEWKEDVLVTFKKNPKKVFPGDFTVLDHERGGHAELSTKPWLNDTSLGSWFHNANGTKARTDTLVDLFVDLVSKNGCLLLNVPPDEKGRITPNAVKVLKEFGQWMKTNGEAIYETRPWIIAEEGSAKIQGKMHAESKATSADIRFTRNKMMDTLYVIGLDWPKDGILKVKTLAQGKVDLSSLNELQLLGSSEPIKWQQDKDGLKLSLGTQPKSNLAHAIKLKFKEAIPTLK